MNNLTPDSRIAAMQLCVSDIIIQKAPEVFYLILAFHANKVMITSNLLKDKRSTFFFRQTLSCFEPTKLHNLFLILQFAFSFCFLQSEWKRKGKQHCGELLSYDQKFFFVKSQTWDAGGGQKWGEREEKSSEILL